MGIEHISGTSTVLQSGENLQNQPLQPQKKSDFANDSAIDHLNDQIEKVNPNEPKTTVEFLGKVLAEQPLEQKPKEKRVYLQMKFSKPAKDMTVFDYMIDLLRAEYKQAGYGILTDSEILMSESAFEAKGFTRRWDGFDLEGLQKAQTKGERFHTTDYMIERANRGGQAVLQYQQFKANESDELKAKAESQTNQMLLDPLRLGGNVPFRFAERLLNTPRDILQQADRGEIAPGSSFGKWLSKKAFEGITGKEIPETPTFSETVKKTTGIDLPSISEIKLPRPFEYQTEKYKREGKIGEEIGATALDILLMKRAITKKPLVTPEPLNVTTKPVSKTIIPEKTISSGEVAKVSQQSNQTVKYTSKEMLSKYKGEETGKIWGTKVKYLSEAERAKLELFVKDGKIYDSAGKLYDTSSASSVFGAGQGKAIFVMDETGRIFASKSQSVGKFHHSSFLSGKPVSSAGEIVVKNGKVVEISNRSGHYQPKQTTNLQIIEELKSKGIDTKNINRTGF